MGRFFLCAETMILAVIMVMMFHVHSVPMIAVRVSSLVGLAIGIIFLMLVAMLVMLPVFPPLAVVPIAPVRAVVVVMFAAVHLIMTIRILGKNRNSDRACYG
jgi:hypothetical protein